MMFGGIGPGTPNVFGIINPDPHKDAGRGAVPFPANPFPVQVRTNKDIFFVSSQAFAQEKLPANLTLNTEYLIVIIVPGRAETEEEHRFPHQPLGRSAGIILYT